MSTTSPPSRSRLPEGRSLASVDGCPQPPSRSRLPQGRSLASVDGCPQPPSRSRLPQGRSLASVDGCPQLSEPFQASTRAVIGISRWVSTTSEPFQASTRAVIGIGRWVSTTSYTPVDGCPQLPTHRSMGVHNSLPQLPKTSFPVLTRPSGQSGGFWNRGRKLKRKDEGMSARSWFGTAFRGR